MKTILPEIMFGGGGSQNAQHIHKLVKNGALRKIASRVYTPNFDDADEKIVKRNLYPILSHFFPGAVISHRTALEGRPTPEGEIFLTAAYPRNVTSFPGIHVHLLKGPAPQPDDSPIFDLFMSSKPRAFLENYQPRYRRESSPKTLSRSEVEDRLEDYCRVYGEEALNTLRDQAKALAEELGMERPFRDLNKTVSAILGTRPGGRLSSASARARSQGLPYDADRLELFNELFSRLVSEGLPIREERELNDDQVNVFAFFEAYFSNFIEGTEFEIAEAHDIVFENSIPPDRPDDAHDILGTFRIVSSRHEMKREWHSFDEFIEVLKARHHMIMESRTAKHPGEFKTISNRAGVTRFVEPDLVEGTLYQGYEMLKALQPGLPRALFLMFLLTEVHPFEDGNGRIARVMMNGELIRSGLSPIIIPSVYRNDYIRSLKQVSNSNSSKALIRMANFAQQFSSELPRSSYEETLMVLTACNAFKDPDEGHLILPSACKGV